MLHGIAFKYFLEVAQTGSLSGASQRLHVAVSAISRQIAHLEEEVGAPLFARAPRGMVLSPAGKLLLAHARRMQLESEDVLKEIAALQGERQDRIRLAASSGPARGILPVTMAEFHRDYPATCFTLGVLSPQEAMRLTIEGEVDISVNFMVEEARGVDVRYSQRAPVCAVMAAGHPLAGRSRIVLEDLRGYPLALTDSNSTARHLLRRVGALDALHMTPVLESNHTEALRSFVMHSQAVTFAGYVSVACQPEYKGLVVRPIADIELQSRRLEILVMQGRQLPQAAERFVERLIARLEELDAHRL